MERRSRAVMATLVSTPDADLPPRTAAIMFRTAIRQKALSQKPALSGDYRFCTPIRILITDHRQKYMRDSIAFHR